MVASLLDLIKEKKKAKLIVNPKKKLLSFLLGQKDNSVFLNQSANICQVDPMRKTARLVVLQPIINSSFNA